MKVRINASVEDVEIEMDRICNLQNRSIMLDAFVADDEGVILEGFDKDVLAISNAFFVTGVFVMVYLTKVRYGILRQKE